MSVNFVRINDPLSNSQNNLDNGAYLVKGTTSMGTGATVTVWLIHDTNPSLDRNCGSVNPTGATPPRNWQLNVAGIAATTGYVIQAVGSVGDLSDSVQDVDFV